MEQWQQQSDQPNSGRFPVYRKERAMVTASLITGILALILLFSFTLIPTMVLGAVSIVLALLSRGSGKAFPQGARTGMICAIIALIANIGILCYSGYTLMYNAQVRSEVNRLYEQIYGVPLEDVFEEAFGIDLEWE
ncbi:MAG: hypothetical protein K6G23_03540 [Lachnospiraceae bacterium]|nr:hypothetical protein [Lachnospiraceae bacterium]